MEISMSSATGTSHIDRIGAGVSFVCAVHCALMPFVIALLPFVGHSFLADGRLENIIVAISITLAGLSVWAGIRVHGERRLLIPFGAALVLIIAGRGSEGGVWEMPCMVLGGLLFVYGHFVNHRLRHCVQPCCAADLVGQDSFRNPELNPGISRTSNHRIESTSD
jgi:MerC mercury resistance protein